ncbi:MAG: universal stress protein [Nitrospirae bacterium]|nr:universal stress protein [Nitrospirota bacterium]
MRNFRKLLIAIDSSREVLKAGLKMANDEKCWVTVVKVLPKYEGDINLVGVKNIEQLLTSDGNKVASDINNETKDERLNIRTRVEYGEPSEKIVEAAEDERCDLIVMGSRKMGWLERFLRGSIVEKVIDNASCPVLVVRV